MAQFPGPDGLAHNRGLVADPAAFAKEHGAASWLYLNGEEFAAVEGGMSYADVQAAGASPADVLARAEADGAPFVQAELLKQWVAQGLGELSGS